MTGQLGSKAMTDVYTHGWVGGERSLHVHAQQGSSDQSQCLYNLCKNISNSTL